jgi:transaldolase
LAKIPKSFKGDERAEALISAVTGEVANSFAQFFGKGDLRLGGVCAQVNPHKLGNIDSMIAQAKRYAALIPNICIKFPANIAGLTAYEECAALGYNVVATVSFTVAQAIAAAEAFKKGSERARKAGLIPGLGVAVIMGGRLYEYLKDVAQDRGLELSEEDVLYSGTVVLKQAYSIFQERGYAAKIMPASGRISSHITDISGADMIMSITPKIADRLGELEGPFTEGINEPIKKDVLDKLIKIDEFKRAFEPDGLKPEDFIAFGPHNRTITQFILSGWDQLVAYEW